jgi:hypothetical protein
MLTVARPSTLPCGAFRARAPTSLGAVRPTQLALSRLQHRPRHAITQRTRTQPRGVGLFRGGGLRRLRWEPRRRFDGLVTLRHSASSVRVQEWEGRGATVRGWVEREGGNHAGAWRVVSHSGCSSNY